MEELYPGEPLIIQGDIESIIFENEETGYSVLEVELLQGGRITVVGIIPYPGEGERIIAEGEFVSHPTYGSQFRCDGIERIMPDQANAIFRYLSSGVVKGVGIATARRIVTKFGIDTFDIIKCNPERLTEIKGITLQRAESISMELNKRIAIKELMVFFSQFGFPLNTALELYRHAGATAQEKITQNPYFLALEPYLVDFRKVDAMALDMGFGEDNFSRIEAGILFELLFNESQGHVYLPYDKLRDVSAQFLSLSEELVQTVLDSMIERDNLKTSKINDTLACYTPRMREAEMFIAQRIVYMAGQKSSVNESAKEGLAKLESKQGIVYSEKQKNAILTSIREHIMILTGGPGTGKTTAVRGMIGLLERIGMKTLVAAPTGRAAKRISELCGCEAKTIHRVLETVFSKDGTMFLRNTENPLDADAVIIDELSMVDLPLFSALLSALKSNCKLIMVGDPDQLPSVGPGTVLSDILKSDAVKIVHLDEIFRQAQESDIVINAHAVNAGELPNLKNNKKDFFFLHRQDTQSQINTICELFAERLPKHMGIDISNIQVITPLRQRETGTQAINPILRDLLNPISDKKKQIKFGNTYFREGDRVMQIKNNYDIVWNNSASQETPGVGVYNGDIGIIKSINPHAEKLTIEFPDKECDYSFDMLCDLEHAYAITVHKSQGSEYRAVIFLASLVHSRLLNRNLFYTAITRAKELFIIVGIPESVEAMVNNRQKRRRYSALCERIVALADGRELI